MRQPAANRQIVAVPRTGEDDGGREIERLRLLAEVSQTMIATLDTGESAAALARLVVPRLCDFAIIAVLGEDGRPWRQGWAHRDPARLADLETYLNGRIRGTGDEIAVADALRSGEPVRLTALDPATVAAALPTEEVRAAWRRLDATSCTVVPLRARAETFGVLALMNSAARPTHTDDEVALAVEVAGSGALALDNARLYGRQLKVAETLQHSLLTPPAQPKDLQVAVRYRPAASHMHVGGDWYDAFGQPDGATMLVIGDVVGHNVDAAAAMGQLRSIIRGLAYDRPGSPAQTLARVDRVLAALRIGTLATALVARLERPADQVGARVCTLRWSSAGHLPPLLRRSNGTVQVLDSPPERLLGAELSRRRTDHQVPLRPGDTVLLYTDGLIEHARSGVDEGLARLVGVLTELPASPVEKVCDQLLDRIVTGHTDDDIALLAVRCPE